ncbi:MAG: VWA domain-containing protein, partial [Elusimicrobia bacterium]|nr:VWA domain-containing protein [Elusimicrobiota bacterium]
AGKAGAPTDLVLIFDTSGSMNESVPGGRKVDVGKAAMWKFVELLPKNTNVGLVAFQNACDVRTVSPIQKASSEARAGLRASIAGLRAEGSTPLGYAVDRATRMLAGSPRAKRIVILTDGEETCDENAFDQAADAAWKAGIKVYAIGFSVGSEPSRNFRRLGIYKDAGDDKQLASVFSDIRKSLERGSSGYDETKAVAAGEAPPRSLVGRKGFFRDSGSPRAGRLYESLQLKSSFEPRFKATDRFTVLEHGYHVLFDPEEFTAKKVEVMKVRLDETLNFAYGGAEGFVLASDVVIE